MRCFKSDNLKCLIKLTMIRLGGYHSITYLFIIQMGKIVKIEQQSQGFILVYSFSSVIKGF
jgi:hypothetical protein